MSVNILHKSLKIYVNVYLVAKYISLFMKCFIKMNEKLEVFKDNHKKRDE